ncbi:MAG: clan AA aspartic protease [Phycisphaerales bacterium]|nr:clan AA aspartic protease [Phycisphaerales bacterium]
MAGIVNQNMEATVRVRIVGRSDDRLEVQCVIDTGFSGALTLPSLLISRLDLRWVSVQGAELADGRVVATNVYAGEAIWNERRVPIEIDEADTDPLLGMALLAGHELNVKVHRGGEVRITALT